MARVPGPPPPPPSSGCSESAGRVAGARQAAQTTLKTREMGLSVGEMWV